MKKNSKRTKTIQRILKTGMSTEMRMKITGHLNAETVMKVYVDSDWKIDDKLLKMKQGFSYPVQNRQQS